MRAIHILIFTVTFTISTFSQSIVAPTVLDLIEDDRVATLYWNSKTNTYDRRYDPDKRLGIFSYLVEWGEVGAGFPNSTVTPYRVTQLQPLEPGKTYEGRIFALNARGQKSAPSEVINFSHDPTRVEAMRERLTGFFDDMNYPMGPFEEKKWNQAYSGCMKIGSISQHINSQYHGHNVIASGNCDRSFAASRARGTFDFTDRTGTIEFDLDGAHMRRHSWYLDISPASDKRDLSGQINSTGAQATPIHLLRIIAGASNVGIQIADELGVLRSIENVYENGACGDRMAYCPGENLNTIINVRRHWRIELSKTHVRIFINDILVVDGSLITEHTPQGLGFETAQLNWVSFSYNTNKENLVMSMVHWDNFGFDAPMDSPDQPVVHNYTDGTLGTDSHGQGNEVSVGLVPSHEDPAVVRIPIPDPITASDGSMPIESHLMFTLQGGHHTWTESDRIEVNGHHYPFGQPSTGIPGMDDNLLSSFTPYAGVIDLDPSHVVQGDNEIKFYLHNHRILNIHIELIFDKATAPEYTPPAQIFTDHHAKLMEFRSIADSVGPGINILELDGHNFLSEEFDRVPQPREGISHWYEKQSPVSETFDLVVVGNPWAQLAAKGVANGIAYLELWMDGVPFDTVRMDLESPVAFFVDTLRVDTRKFSNGLHEFYIQAYDTKGNPSLLDVWSASSYPGEYLPTLLEIQNTTTSFEIATDANSISIFPNPSRDIFTIVGDLTDYRVRVLNVDGGVHQEFSASGSALDIDLSALPSGMYFLQVSNQNHTALSIEKILKY